jgi:hypothetical protein
MEADAVTERPLTRNDVNVYAFWERAIDGKGRLLPSWRSRSVEIRCDRGHLVAYLIRTPLGDLWARRKPWVERDTQHGFEVGWADVDGPQEGRCMSCRRSWIMDPALIDQVGVVMRPSQLASRPAVTPPTGGPNPFA